MPTKKRKRRKVNGKWARVKPKHHSHPIGEALSYVKNWEWLPTHIEPQLVPQHPIDPNRIYSRHIPIEDHLKLQKRLSIEYFIGQAVFVMALFAGPPVIGSSLAGTALYFLNAPTANRVMWNARQLISYKKGEDFERYLSLLVVRTFREKTSHIYCLSTRKRLYTIVQRGDKQKSSDLDCYIKFPECDFAISGKYREGRAFLTSHLNLKSKSPNASKGKKINLDEFHQGIDWLRQHRNQIVDREPIRVVVLSDGVWDPPASDKLYERIGEHQFVKINKDGHTTYIMEASQLVPFIGAKIEQNNEERELSASMMHTNSL